MPPQDSEQARWFAEELQPHEPMLRAWLRSRFPRGFDIDDVVQEAYLRVLQARDSMRLQSPKAFLFATARNLALNRLRHQWVERVDPLTETEVESVMDDGHDIPEALARAQELELLTKAIQSLPTRCRQVLTLRKIYGMAQKDVALELGISEHTVEAQGVIGLRKIGEYFRRQTERPS
jgi:RNA polymerase sigma-70 factor (ECF subfamily)